MTDYEKEIFMLKEQLERKNNNPFSGISLNTIMQTLIIAGILYMVSRLSGFSDFMLLQTRQNDVVNTALERIEKKQEDSTIKMVTQDDFTEKLIPLKNQINLNTGELNNRTSFMDKTDNKYQELKLENTVIKNRLDNLENSIREN